MAEDRRSVRALAALLPAGAFGLSVSLAAADATATLSQDGASDPAKPCDVAKRLQSIRATVSEAVEQYAKDGKPFVAVDPETQLAWWGNGGWRNGGWRNGGWGNGGWHNWGNGGWHNWGNGWHNWGNGWHNGWLNW
jgi:rSAM-associated Gly-rich repeat protein